MANRQRNLGINIRVTPEEKKKLERNFDPYHDDTLGTSTLILFMGYSETVRMLRFCQKLWNTF